MSDAVLNRAEQAFLARFAVRSIWGFRFRHPKPTPENVAMVEALETRGLITRKITGAGFLALELTRLGRTAMKRR